MLFRDKSPEVIYFEECLINPPTFPGTLPTARYLDEVAIELIAGYKTLDTASEIVGEVWGTMCANIVIASCIASEVMENGTKRDAKAIDAAFNKLISKQNQIKSHSPSRLNMYLVSEAASRSLRYLISGGQPNTVLQTEMSVTSDIQNVRYLAVKQYAPSRLREYLYDGIESLTGIRPEN